MHLNPQSQPQDSEDADTGRRIAHEEEEKGDGARDHKVD